MRDRQIRLKLKLPICFVLALATFAIYWQVRSHEFVNYDDDLVLASNPHVVSGLAWDNIHWAFQAHSFDYWRPLTWLSYMLDCQLFGLNPGALHLANVLYHLACTLLLFLALQQMTGATWRSAWIAGLFAWHPLQVQSVAWASERGEALSGCFWMLTLWAYARYAQKGRAGSPLPAAVADTSAPNAPTLQRSNASTPQSPIGNPQSAICNPQSAIGHWPWYSLALLFFALGLMCKPTLVTLPFVLLLLDYWPLHRFQLLAAAKRSGDGSAFSLQPSPLRRLLLEKLPFFALTMAASAITFFGQQNMGNVAPVEALSIGLRLGNASISYLRYLGKALWPAHLAFFYPHPGRWPAWLIAGALLLLLAVSFMAVRAGRRRPWLLTGWLWFLGMLLPVIGLVQVGSQSMADRYAYLPVIGLFIMLVWSAADLLIPLRHGRTFLGGLALASLLSCAVTTWFQVRHWRNSEALFRHAIEVTDRNFVAYSLLGVELDRQGKSEEAMRCYLQSLRFNPSFPQAHFNLALRSEKENRLDEAVARYGSALRFNPRYAEAYNNLGILLRRQGRLDQARNTFTELLRIQPDFAGGHFNLGLVFALDGRPADAAARYLEAIRLRPDYARALNNLAWLRATSRDPKVRNGGEAVRLARRVVELTSEENPESLDTLAAAQAEAGQFSEAVRNARRALELAVAAAQQEWVGQLRSRLSNYESGKPYRE